MKWRVVIPTYKRAARISIRTLDVLEQGGVPAELIDLFVANEQEKEEYLNRVPKDLYNRIIVGELGIAQQRNFISDYFPDGELLVSADDDLQGVYVRESEKKVSLVQNLPALFDQGFFLCQQYGARIWGMYPVLNPKFMRHGYTHDLKPVIGALHGYVNDRSLRLSCKTKDDIERTLLYYEVDGVVIRMNSFAPKQNARTEPGGLQAEGETKRTLERSEEDVRYMMQRWPALVHRAKPRKGGHAEVRLRDTRIANFAVE